MRVQMIGTISGFRAETGKDGQSVYSDNPKRGDVVDVDDDVAANWIATGMAKLAEDPPVETRPVKAAAEKR